MFRSLVFCGIDTGLAVNFYQVQVNPPDEINGKISEYEIHENF